MKRKEFIRNVVLSCGLLFLPRTLISFIKEQKLHVVIIGDNELRYIEQFCKQNSITSCTSIGWNKEHINDFNIANNNCIDFDFSSITINQANLLYNQVVLPQSIKDIFGSNNKYLILCSLYKRNAILCKEIINWLDSKAIDFGFFGSIPLLNPWLSARLKPILTDFENDPRVRIFDVNVFGNKLRRENGDQLFTEAIDKCDDMLVGELENFYFLNVEH